MLNNMPIKTPDQSVSTLLERKQDVQNRYSLFLQLIWKMWKGDVEKKYGKEMRKRNVEKKCERR